MLYNAMRTSYAVLSGLWW